MAIVPVKLYLRNLELYSYLQCKTRIKGTYKQLTNKVVLSRASLGVYNPLSISILL